MQINRWLPLFFLFLCVVLTGGADAGDLQSLRDRNVEVFFDASLKRAAQEVLDLYPEVRKNIESIFMWELNARPTIVLIKTRAQFLHLAGNPRVVAYAVPEKKLIVIDYSKMIKHPFSLETSMKHEVSHLLLHQHIPGELLPRWLDEGLCQWASDGIGEIIMDPKQSFLNRASLSGRFIPLRALERNFPDDRESQLLAYEESKSFVVYIVRIFGKQSITAILNSLRNGVSVDAAIQKTFSIPFEILEKKWHHSLKKKATWFALVSYHLYEILFVLMALITVVAFFRQRFMKKDYEDEEDDESFSNPDFF